MKIVVIILAVMVVLVALVALVGAMLPRAHVATRSAAYQKTPAQLYAVVRDFASQPTWHSGLKSVELLAARDGQVCFRELSRHGAVTYVVLEDIPGEKLVVKIADENLPFGGTWTFEFSAGQGSAAGTHVRITEQGEVKNLIFRTLARFVFGYTSTIEGYLRDLGKKFGEATEPKP